MARRVLPAGLGLELDIIAHSRGGLVARELAQRGSDNGLDGKLHVRSVTFVGTPNRGTPLCEPEHLGSYVDAMTNLLSVLPDNGVTDAVDCVVGVLSHVAAQGVQGSAGRDGDESEGRLPEGRSIANACRRTVTSESSRPSSNRSSGSDWKRHLRDLVVDKVFRGQPNDLIVPTDADWEQDRVKTRLVLDKSKGIDHSTYWTDDQVIAALEPDAQTVTAEPTRGRAAPPVECAPNPPRPTDPRNRATAAGAKSRRRRRGTRIDVEVVHGSLEHAQYPIVVGHQQGAPIEGAEGYVDDRLGGRLSRRQLLGLYPEDEGQLLYLPLARPRGRREYSSSVSGAADEMTATKIVRVVTQAATACLVAEMEARETGADGSDARQEDRPEHGPAGNQSADRFAGSYVRDRRDRWRRAARTSTFVPSTRPPNIARSSATALQITGIEFVERDEDRAEVAARTLLKSEASLPDGVVPATRLRVGEGGRSARPATDERSVAWSTLRIGRNTGRWRRRRTTRRRGRCSTPSWVARPVPRSSNTSST